MLDNNIQNLVDAIASIESFIEEKNPNTLGSVRNIIIITLIGGALYKILDSAKKEILETIISKDIDFNPI